MLDLFVEGGAVTVDDRENNVRLLFLVEDVSSVIDEHRLKVDHFGGSWRRISRLDETWQKDQ